LPVRYYDWIAHFGRRTPDKLAMIDLASGCRFTYAQFDMRISRLATHLRDQLKVARGDRVAVLALNTTDTLEVQFACGRIGAIFLPLNTRLTVPELQYIVGDASPDVMIHDAELAETALAVAKLCNVSSTLLLGPGGSYEAGIASRLGKNSFPARLQSAVECGTDSCRVVANSDSETRPAGLQVAADDYNGIEQQNWPV
jgi:fatty-acyl-CoA synthase